MLRIINMVSMKIAPKGKIPPTSIIKGVFKNHFCGLTGFGTLLTRHGNLYSSVLWPIPLTRKVKGTEIPNCKMTRVIKVLKGTAPELLSKINKKFSPIRKVKQTPGKSNDVIKAFPFQFSPLKVLYSLLE